MSSLVRELLDLPVSVPKCVIEVGDFDTPSCIAQTVRDYVLTADIRRELVGPATDESGSRRPGLLQRIRASVERSEPGDGHWVHGSFGSGKSHFMSLVGLVLMDHPELWANSEAVASLVQPEEREWLGAHAVLVVPIFMQSQRSLETAIYTQVNARLDHLGKDRCAFTDVDGAIAGFEAKREVLGDAAFRLLELVGLDRDQYLLLVDDEDAREELAARILHADGHLPTDDIRGLYPPSLTEGMRVLCAHARTLGYSAVLLLVDELILYLAGKSGRNYIDEINALGALVDSKGGRACPLWVVVARQRNIMDTVPGDTSENHIHEALQRLADRFPRETQLQDHDLTYIAQERILRPRDEGASVALRSAVDSCLAGMDPDTRQVLVSDWSEDDFRRLYPFHPALLQTLVDITNQLSRERTAIRVLYELLIVRYPDLAVGQLVPYHGLFDVVFTERGVLDSGHRRTRELEGVRRTYHEELRPAIGRAFPDDEDQQRRAATVLKTVLLCQLTRGFGDDITVGRIVNLNPEDLRGKRSLASHAQVAAILTALSNQCELVVFRPDAANPGAGHASVNIQEGVRLATDILPRISVSQQDRSSAFMSLMRELLGREIKDGAVPGFKHKWRGTERPAKVIFANVSELSPASMTVSGEFTLYIDHPYDIDPTRSVADDEEVVRRARADLGALPIGFWLPQFLDAQALADLEQLAKLELLSGSGPTSEELKAKHIRRLSQEQQDQVQHQLFNFRASKRTALLQKLEDCYLRGAAQCVFLDTAIQPSLDTGSLEEALERIADTVLDRLHPNHPRFRSTVQASALQALLEDVVLPARRSGNRIEADTTDIRTRIEAVATPLELGTLGNRNWTLEESGRYLRRVLDLASEQPATTDDIRSRLVAEFGFPSFLVDFFLLLVTRGFGYRAFRGSEAVPETALTWGKLDGLRLVKGRALAPVKWFEAKRRIQRGWAATGLREEVGPETGAQLDAAIKADHSVAAQDDLWRAVHEAAGAVARLCERARAELSRVANAVGSELDARFALLERVCTLNGVARADHDDSHDGLTAIVQWASDDGQTDCALDALAQIPALDEALSAIDPTSLEAVSRRQASEQEATELARELATVLGTVGQDATLSDRTRKWSQDARSWVVGPPKPDAKVLPPRTCCTADLDAKLAEAAGEVRSALANGAPAVTFSITVKADVQ